MIETILTDLFFCLCAKYPKEDWMIIIPEHYDEWIALCMDNLGTSFPEDKEYILFMRANAPTCLH